MNRNLPMDTNKNRYDKPVKTPVWGAEVANPNSITFKQRVKTTAAEVGWSLPDMTEPRRCQETAVAAEGAGTVATANEWDRSINCIKRNATGWKLATKSDEFMEPIPDRVWPVVTETAPADGTGGMQYQGEDRDYVGMTAMLMPRNYLEIPEPRIPGVFLELAEEARNVILVDGQSCDTEEVQPQRTGLTKRVFVAEMVDSPPVLKKRALRVTGTSTEMMPNINLRGRDGPVNRSGPVDLQNNTEQPVFLGFDTAKRGNAPTGPVGHYVILAERGDMVDRLDLVGPHNSTEQSAFLGLDVDQEDVSTNIVHPGVQMYRNQPVTDGSAGPDRTSRPVGTDGMHAVHDAGRPMAGGPVGRLFTLDPLGPGRMPSLDELNQPLAMGPLGTEGIHAVNDSDRPSAGGPVGRLFSLDPMGPSGMSSSDEWNQPPAVGPVGKSFITGPLGNHGNESDCMRTIQIRSESESSIDVPDPEIQTGSDVQTDRVNIGIANGQAGSGDTPPSSDSGDYSLGEQWENMSINSMDMESEQNEKPSYGGDTRQLVSVTSRPLDTEEGIRFDCPSTDYVLERESDGVSSVIIQREDREVEFNKLTICDSEHSIVYSGTDGRFSDIAAMSDFSDDYDETHEEFRPGLQTESDRDGTIEEESSLCDRPITNTVTICESAHIIVYSGTDDRNSDIAAMSDFF